MSENNKKHVSIYNDNNIFSNDNHPVFKFLTIYYRDKDENDQVKLRQSLPGFTKLQEWDKKMRTDELGPFEKNTMMIPRILSIMRAGINQAINDRIGERTRDLAMTSLETKMLEPRNKDGKLLGWEWNNTTSNNEKRVLIVDGFRITLPEIEYVPEKYTVWQRPNMMKVTGGKGGIRLIGWHDVSTIHIDKYIALSQPIVARAGDTVYFIPQVREFVDSEAINVVPTGYVFY